MQYAHTHKNYAAVKRGFLILLTATGIFSNLLAQSLPSAVFNAKEVILKTDDRDWLDQSFEDYTVVQLDYTALNEYVKDYTKSELTLVVQNTLSIPFQTFNLILEENDLRAPNYLAVINDGANPTLDMQAMYGPVTTYKGIAESGEANDVRLNISDQGVWGFILTGNEFTYIEPLKNIIAAMPSDHFIIYRVLHDATMNRNSRANPDVLFTGIGESHGCATGGDDNGEDDLPGDLVGVVGEMRCTTYTVTIATEADFQIADRYAHRGVTETDPSFTYVNTYLLQLINESESAYSHLIVKFKVIFQNAWWEKAWTESSNNDPYTDGDFNYSIGDIKDDFENYWEANFSGVGRHVAHMWTGKNYPMGGVGVASGRACQSYNAYSVSRHISFTDEPDWGWGQHNTLAHEIAHNLSANHDPNSKCPDKMGVGAGPIMCQTVRKTDFYFSSRSLKELKTFLSSHGSCLAAVDIPCPPIGREANHDGLLSERAGNERETSFSTGFSTGNYGNDPSKNPVSVSVYSLTGQLLYRRTGSGTDHSVKEWMNSQMIALPAVIVHTTHEDGRAQIKKVIF